MGNAVWNVFCAHLNGVIGGFGLGDAERFSIGGDLNGSGSRLARSGLPEGEDGWNNGNFGDNLALHGELEGRICRVIGFNEDGFVDVARSASECELGGQLGRSTWRDGGGGEFGGGATAGRAAGGDHEIGVASVFEFEDVFDDFGGVACSEIEGSRLAGDAR